MTNPQAVISEIFQSIQGEGVYVGERQVFVRFSGCNIACEYCDTVESKSQILNPKSPPASLREALRAGQTNSKSQEENPKCAVKNLQELEYIDNPISLEKVLEIINKYIARQNLFHSVVFTGGEPLLQINFLKDLLPKVKYKKYLETNGIFHERLAEIIDFIDIIAMDFKLPSATKTDSYFDDHKKFIKTAKSKELFIKAVFSKETTAREIEETAQIIADIDHEIPLILQPVTPSRHYKSKPSPCQCLSFQAIAKRKLAKVLVIPQVHKILEVD